MKLTITVDASLPDDTTDSEVDELREDVEDVVRTWGGYGVIVGLATGR